MRCTQTIDSEVSRAGVIRALLSLSPGNSRNVRSVKARSGTIILRGLHVVRYSGTGGQHCAAMRQIRAKRGRS